MDTLPPEVMTLILDLLSFTTVRQTMTTMNKTWYFASLHPMLLRKEFFVYNELRDDSSYKYENFKNALINTERKFLQLKLQNLTFDHVKYLTIFENCGDRISTLCLDGLSSFTDSYLKAISSYCQNLEKLNLFNIHTFSIDNPCKPIPKLRSVTFDVVSNMSDKVFNFIIQCAPNLEHLNFIDCQIITWPQIIRRFYTNEFDSTLMSYNSDAVFTDLNILNNLKNAKRIKGLKLQNCFHMFYKLPEHIKLNSLLVELRVNIRDQHVDIEAFKLKLEEHTSLEKLEITYIPCCYLPAISRLCNLKCLTLTFTNDVNSNCIDQAACFQRFCDSLKNLKNLKKLRISQCPSYNVRTQRLIPTIPDSTLSSLKLLDSSVENTLKVVNFGQNLVYLRIQNDKILQSSDFSILFSSLTNLRYLAIECCVELTDAILLSSPISNIKGLCTLHLINTRLTHRSLRQIKLLHLENLIITCVSIRACIERRSVRDFEESMMQLSYSTPVLTSLLLSIPVDEVILLQYDDRFNNSLSNHNNYIHYFKNLKKYQLLR